MSLSCHSFCLKCIVSVYVKIRSRFIRNFEAKWTCRGKKMEEQIVRTYADMVYRIAYRYVKNSIDTDDVFSEVFLAYFKKERSFESEEHRKAWLIRVTINCAKDCLEKRARWQQLYEETLPDRGVSKTDAYLDLHAAIEQLCPDYREVIKLYYLDDLSVKQIAQVLDKNENTVKTQLSRARILLKASLLA